MSKHFLTSDVRKKPLVTLSAAKGRGSTGFPACVDFEYSLERLCYQEEPFMFQEKPETIKIEVGCVSRTKTVCKTHPTEDIFRVIHGLSTHP